MKKAHLALLALSPFASASAYAISPSITGLNLINTATGQTYSSVSGGGSIDLSKVDQNNLSIRATISTTPSSVVFNWDNNAYTHTEGVSPYDMCSDSQTNSNQPLPCSVLAQTGSHTLTVTPYDTTSAKAAGAPLTVNISITEPSTAPPPSTSSSGHYMYMAVAPSVESPTIPYASGVYVYDIDHSHTYVETIPFPTSAPKVLTIRGVMADPASNTLYLSYYGSTSVQTAGYLLAMDLKTGAQKWVMNFSPSNNNLQNSGVDRGCLTHDGKTIFLPTGEEVAANRSWWYQIDVASHTVTKQIPFSTAGAVAGAHNTICAKSGLVYMASIASMGATNANHALSLKSYNPANGATSYIGPFGHRIRPFTLNASGAVFVNEEDWVGFGYGAPTGSVAEFPAGNGYVEPPISNIVQSHGVAVTADDKFVWIADANDKQSPVRHGLHVWGLVGATYGYIGYLPTASTPSYQTFAAPGWIMGTLDNQNATGKQYLYAETGEIIDTTKNTTSTLPQAIVGVLKDPKTGIAIATRFGLEVDFNGTVQTGTATRAGDQVVIGQ